MKFDCINFFLTNAQNAVFLHFKHALQPYDITPVQHAVLQCLWVTDRQTPSMLAERLHLDTSTITGILSRMEAKELLQRTFCETDRRRVIVQLLPAGIELKEKLGNTIEIVNRTLLEDFTPEEAATLKKFLFTLEEKAKNV
ncbi:MAG: MarR family transcriptional regulator [Oscillospiraceae bacterium]|nr:MarR family transcriptional regulator [Oscillospiraceae bacterium]